MQFFICYMLFTILDEKVILSKANFKKNESLKYERNSDM